jgi:hypothetical protein
VTNGRSFKKLFLFLGCLIVAALGGGKMPADTLAFAAGTTSVTNLQPPKHVLILNSHDYGMPWQSVVNRSIDAVMKADSSITSPIILKFEKGESVYMKMRKPYYFSKEAEEMQ